MRIVLIVAYIGIGLSAAARAFAHDGAWAYVFGAIAIGSLLLAYATWAKSRFGLNPEQVSCPRCGQEQEKFRKPRSVMQAMFGGYTCTNCGCDMDQWGRELKKSETA